jgi:hypothetical protein
MPLIDRMIESARPLAKTGRPLYDNLPMRPIYAEAN